jgi:hypothetical protein
MSGAVRISVALAVRNGERYLEPLLTSLLRQTEPPHEVVVLDDASDDSTVELVSGFSDRAPFPVRIGRNEARRGPTEAFIDAARRCRGDAVAFCDQDDVWLEHKLEHCRGELERTGAGLVLHSTRLVDSELRELRRTWPVIGKTRLVQPLGMTGLEVDAPGMAMVFRRELLEVAPFSSRPPSRYGNGERMLHDEWIFFLAGVAGPIELLAEPLVLYRQHEDSHSGGWVEHRRHLSLQPALDDYAGAAAHTAACADYLEHTSAGSAGLGKRLVAGARHYRRASNQWGLRLSLYTAPGRRRRAKMLRQLVAGSAYRPRSSGGFGRAALGKDLAAGLALGASARSKNDR